MTSPQQLEQRLGSVRYLVKQCSHCGNVQKYSDDVDGSQYKRCPHCGTRALQLVSTHKLRSREPGVAYIKRQEYHCLYCDQDHHKDTKVADSDDSGDVAAAILGTVIGSSLGRGFGGGGFGGGFGGGGFGGGSGGGGGATGGW